MRQTLIQKIENYLSGKEFSMTNQQGLTHHIYPCQSCGGVMYHLYNEDMVQLISIELNDIEGLDIARQMWNRMSRLKPMTISNFVDFLVHLSILHEQSNVEPQYENK